jgi:hypothetical protein
MEPNGLDAYKPWPLASTFGVPEPQDDTHRHQRHGHMYVYQRPTRWNAGKTSTIRETYAIPRQSSTACPPSTRRPIWTPASVYEGMINGEAASEEPGAGPGPAGADCRHV